MKVSGSKSFPQVDLAFFHRTGGESGELIVIGNPSVDGEDFLKILRDVDFQPLAADEDGVQDGRAVPGLWMADENRVFLADCGRPDGVVIDGDLAVVDVLAQGTPLIDCVVTGFAQLALGQHSVS